MRGRRLYCCSCTRPDAPVSSLRATTSCTTTTPSPALSRLERANRGLELLDARGESTDLSLGALELCDLGDELLLALHQFPHFHDEPCLPTEWSE